MFIPIKDYNPTKRTAYVTILLIGINIAIYLYQSFLSPQPFDFHIGRYAMVPYEIAHLKNTEVPVLIDEREVDKWLVLLEQGEYIKKGTYRVNVGNQIRWAVLVERDIPPFLTLLTSIFMHGTLWHLLGNMLFLWIFGNNIEDYLGKLKFLIFYLLCGIGASLIHAIFNINSTIPVIGASGAVSGIMGAYLILFPNAKVRTLVFLFIFITFVDVPAFAFLAVWFIFQFLYAGGQSSIAWLAHVGGFILGIIIIKRMQRRPKIRIQPHPPDDDDDYIDIIQ